MLERVEPTVGIAAASALADPVRRRVYEAVAAAHSPVGREDVAASVGIGTSLAGYHLDLLAKHDLLIVTFARRSGRTGPGAGRPAKLYARAAVEVQVQLPPRDDALLAHLLAAAVERDTTGGARAALADVAHDAGQQIGRHIADQGPAALDGDDPTRLTLIIEVLNDRGYQAYEDGGSVRLRNCPFHHLTASHLELVCGLNHTLLTAVTEAAGAPVRAQLHPSEGHCCVQLTPAPADRTRRRRRS